MAPKKKEEPPKEEECVEEEYENPLEDPKYKTPARFDPRFPNQNQTRHCFQSYTDYYRCQRLRGEEYAPCDYFRKVFTSICPNFWIEKWDTQREEGIFPGKI